ncbi:MAG: hypothetical protein Fur0037_28020 [Planctomycetota bacterium]
MRDEKRAPPRVAFCSRISTDEDHQKYSLGAQSERLEAFCKAQWDDDWQLYKVYCVSRTKLTAHSARN